MALTSNTLIILADGCYIELICFVPGADEEKVERALVSLIDFEDRKDGLTTHVMQRWGPDRKTKGWKDWCLTTKTSAQENHSRLKTAGSHSEPIAGARKRADGKEVRWSVTFPTGELGGQTTRGKIPFFCHDATPRDLRVPINDTSVKHPNGVLGVHSITVLVESERDLEDLEKVYREVTGVSGVQNEGGVWFRIGRVEDVAGLETGPRILLRVAKSEEENERVKARGFWYGNVVLSVEAREGREVGKRERVDGGEDDVGGIWVEYV